MNTIIYRIGCPAIVGSAHGDECVFAQFGTAAIRRVRYVAPETRKICHCLASSEYSRISCLQRYDDARSIRGQYTLGIVRDERNKKRVVARLQIAAFEVDAVAGIGVGRDS